MKYDLVNEGNEMEVNAMKAIANGKSCSTPIYSMNIMDKIIVACSKLNRFHVTVYKLRNLDDKKIDIIFVITSAPNLML